MRSMSLASVLGFNHSRSSVLTGNQWTLSLDLERLTSQNGSADVVTCWPGRRALEFGAEHRSDSWSWPVVSFQAWSLTPHRLVIFAMPRARRFCLVWIAAFSIAAAERVKRINVDNMKIILSVVVLCLATAVASAQSAPAQDPILSENTVKVSDHVWAIMGWPNIGIVVGENVTLVVDTGLGPRNGAHGSESGEKNRAQ